MSARLGSALAAVLLTSACGSGAEVGEGPRTTSADETASAAISSPPVTGGLDYQLGAAYPTDAAVVVRDASAPPAPNAYSVCYVNGFQTQPDARDQWSGRESALLRTAGGEPVTDPDWPDEMILDPSTSAGREEILDVVGPQITGCAESGFDAVEIDNLDTWIRFPQIDAEGAAVLARSYVALAHSSGLAIAQKNASEAAETAHDEWGFDFAVTEECSVFDECHRFTDVYDDHVLQIEYPDSLAEAALTFSQVCALPGRAPLTILRDRDLVGPDDDGYTYSTC